MTDRAPGLGRYVAALGKMAAFVGLFMGCQFVVSYVYLVGLLTDMGLDFLEDPNAFNTLYERLAAASIPLTLVSGLLTLAIVAVVYFAIRRMSPAEAVWLRPVHGGALWVGAICAPALYMAVTMVMALLPQQVLDGYTEASAVLDDVGPVAFLCVVIVSPVVEEVIFRGLVMTRLARVMNPWTAVLISACVFGVCHGQIVWFCYAFFLGVIFGLMDMQARSILPSILGHIAFNFIGQMITTADALFPEERWVLPAFIALILAGVILVIVFRKDVAALFRPLPAVPEEDVPQFDDRRSAAPDQSSSAYYERLAGEDAFLGENTYTSQEDETEQDPWEG